VVAQLYRLGSDGLWHSPGRTDINPSFIVGVTKPDATNTGIAALGLSRDDLTDTDTSTFVPVAGTTYTGLNFTGPSIIAAVTGVTFEHCYFGCGTNTTGLAQVNLFNAGTWDWTFNNCIFRPDETAPVELDNVGGHDFTVYRCDLSGGTDGVGIFNTHNSGGPVNVQILGCYMHGFAFNNDDPDHESDSSHPGWSHNDLLTQIQGGSNIMIKGNNVQVYLDPDRSVGYLTTPNANAALTYLNYGAGVTISPNVSAVSEVTITQNWFNGGTAVFQMNSAQYSGGTSSIGDLSYNRFGLDQHSFGALGKYQIRMNSGLNFTGLTTNYFDPDDPTAISAGVAGNAFSEGLTTGIRINGVD